MPASNDRTKPRSGTFDTVPPRATIASRIDSARLGLPGVGTYVEELLAALDATLTLRKAMASALAGGVLGAVGGAIWLATVLFNVPWVVWTAGAIGLLALCWLQGGLSRMTYIELSQLRPSRWRDGVRHGGGRTLQLFLLNGLAVAVLGGMILGLRLLPDWCLTLTAEAPDFWQAAVLVVPVLTILAEAIVWPIFLLVLPTAPILVVEQGSLSGCLGIWWKLVRRSGGKLLLAETMALAMAGLTAVPMLALLALTGTSRYSLDIAPVVVMARYILGGILFSLPLAYLLVANVFIFLRLNYDMPEG